MSFMYGFSERGFQVKQNIEFNKKKHIWNGVASCILVILECILFLILTTVSFLQKGNAGSWVGMGCVVIVLMALWGIYIGVKGVTKRKRVYKRSSWIGILCNVIMIVGIGCLFWRGLS